MITEKLIFKIPYEIAPILTPSEIFGANYYEDWDADLGVSDTGGLVDTWTSQGLNGGVFTGSGATRPNTFGGLGGTIIEFDGISEYLEVTGSTADYKFLHENNGGCVITVYSVDSLPPVVSVILGTSFGTANRGIREQINSIGESGMVATNGTSNMISIPSSDSSVINNYISTVNVYDASQAVAADKGNLILNGTDNQTNTQTASPIAGNAAGNLTMGMRANFSPDFFLNGRVKRVIIADTVPTPTQLTQIQTYLNSTYGTFPI